MRHGKFQSQKSKISPALLVILILAVLGTSFGGVRAYLSLLATDHVSNSFSIDSDPELSVDSNHYVTVKNTNYPVYLRAAVVVNWMRDDKTILADMPAGTDYSLSPGENWFLHTDGFYYYNQAVSNGTLKTPVVTLRSSKTNGDYKLVVNVAVQAIQAVGTTDEGSVTAVVDAWKVQPDGNQSPENANP